LGFALYSNLKNEMIKKDKIFNGLDTLRALAITMVFLFHYRFFLHPAWMDNIFEFGWVGVDLFFVLSGFLISTQLFEEFQNRNKIDVSVFYLKRIFRILPPYLFVLCLYIFIPPFHERETLPPLWKMFTFTQNFNQDIAVYGTFSHSWSLCVEEQFYLLLPVILIFLFSFGIKTKFGWLLPAVFLLILLLRAVTWQFYLKPMEQSDNFGMEWYKNIYYPTYTRLDGLITGVAIASLYRFKENLFLRLKHFGNWFILAGFIVFGCCYFVAGDQHSGKATIFSFSLIAIAFGFFVLSAISPGSWLFRFKSAVTKNLAVLSYSLYLSHKGLIHITQGIFGKMFDANSNWMLLLCVFICILGALAMRIFIEKPALKIRNKILSIIYLPM
jgi:peptidoglycan/LPS O-acetylase OafA/YrhL